MHLLALDTSTDTLSIAVQHGTQVLAHSSAGGVRASTALLPAVLELLAQAGLTPQGLDAVVFGRGPGAFSGVRTACAVAQGLAFGAWAHRGDAGQEGLPVLPVDTLLAIAEQARCEHSCTRVVVALDARMDEVYTAPFEWLPQEEGKLHESHGHWHAPPELALCAPEAVQVPPGWAVAGNARTVYGERLAPGVCHTRHVHALPTATALLRLAPALLAAGAAVPASAALPRYVRDKVAQTTAQRLAALAARQGVAATP